MLILKWSELAPELKDSCRWLARIVATMLLAGTLFSPVAAHAQSCALCYTQAASAGARFIQALRSGILILIVPPTVMSVGMIFVVYRKRNQCRQPDDKADSYSSW
jgi:hypothetical protein